MTTKKHRTESRGAFLLHFFFYWFHDLSNLTLLEYNPMEHSFVGLVIDVPVNTPEYNKWIYYIQRLCERGVIFTTNIRRRLKVSESPPSPTHMQVNLAYQSFVLHDEEGTISMYMINPVGLSENDRTLFIELSEFYTKCLNQAQPRVSHVF